jgi:hypothetical protein
MSFISRSRFTMRCQKADDSDLQKSLIHRLKFVTRSQRWCQAVMHDTRATLESSLGSAAEPCKHTGLQAGTSYAKSIAHAAVELAVTGADPKLQIWGSGRSSNRTEWEAAISRVRDGLSLEPTAALSPTVTAGRRLSKG